MIPQKVPLTHVTGKVLVDGKPTAGVSIRYVPVSATAETRPEYQVGIVDSDANGQFSLSTYEDKDGVPSGEYALSFSLLAKNDKAPGSKNRPQLLAPIYTDVQKPFRKIAVERGKDLDIGEIVLGTNSSVVRKESSNDNPNTKSKN